MPNSSTSSVKLFAARHGLNVRTVYMQIKSGKGVGPYFEKVNGKLRISDEKEQEYIELQRNGEQ